MGYVVLLILFLLLAIRISNALDHYDLLAVNNIEKKIKSLVDKKPLNWQQEANLRIKQLETQYVPKGYDQGKVVSLKKMMTPQEPAAYATPEKPLNQPIFQAPPATMYGKPTENIVQKKEQLPEESPQEIEQKLDQLLLVPEEERPDNWKAIVNKNIFALSITEPEKAQEYFETLYVKPVETPSVKIEVPAEKIQEQPVETAPVQQKEQLPEKSAEEIENELNEFLLIPNEERSDTWKAIVNKNIFALSITEPEKAQQYFETLYVKPVETPSVKIEVPAEEIQEQPVETAPVQQKEQLPEKGAEQIESELNELLLIPNEERSDTWKDIVSKNIFALGMKEPEKAQEYLEKIYVQKQPITAPEEQEPSVVAQQEQQVQSAQAAEPVDEAKKINTISLSIDELLALPAEQKTSDWEKEVNELIFELSSYDKEKARVFMKKIYVRAGAPMPPSVPGAGPKQGTPPPPPPMPGMPGQAPKPGTPPPPPPLPGAAGPKPGGPKAPPMPVKPVAPKAPAITLGNLRKMEDEKLLETLDKHLADLDKNWNSTEKVVTGPSGKLVKIMGSPEEAWERPLESIKKVVLERKLMSENDLQEKINKHIEFVRSEKAKMVKAVVQEEKATVEETQQDIERRLKFLLAEPKQTDGAWLSNVKRSIKKLDEYDNEAALRYQDKFIAVMQEVDMTEKKFIKVETQEGLEKQLEELFAAPKPANLLWSANTRIAIKKLNQKDHDAALNHQEKFITLMDKAGITEERFIK